MGNLPAMRVNEELPFSNVGIDYCGPLYIKEKKFRNRNKIKVYVVVFVCLTIEAIHLELVSDLTTEAFLASLKRFIARRGKCKNIYSDNGTNFIGANNELKELHKLLTSKTHQSTVDAFLTNEGTHWHFIPPQTPNFGGLWEAGVRSFKHHLRRVVGNELFTYEELNTVVVQIEAILNSRPITSMSSDPNDFRALTPGHFLIGRPLTALPEYDFRYTPTNRLSHWHYLEKVKRDFWVRWHKEYLNELNHRQKWTQGQHSIKEGSLVVLRDDNLPPLQWALGRVVRTYPGSDDIILIVDVKTSTGTYQRNVRKLAPLPQTEPCQPPSD
ncbi:hypothetical protein ANTPLA_LOCUS675 [Anthophora plagiata]